MADRDLYGLVIALTAWIADPTRGNLILNPGIGQKREIIAHHLPDGPDMADVATVVRLGAASPPQFDPFDRISAQILTRGKPPVAAWARAQAIHNVLRDQQRRPLRHVTLNAHWMLHLIDASPPQSIGDDEGKRAQIVINVNLSAGLLPE